MTALGFPKCPTLPSIPNGEVDYPNQEPDTTATYSCNNGFVLVGQETRKCGQDGQWTGEQPSCKIYTIRSTQICNLLKISHIIACTILPVCS